MAKENKHPSINPLHRGKIVIVLIAAFLITLGVAVLDAFLASNVFNAIF